MDPKNQPQFNPKIPISEVLKQEQTGFTPSAPKPGGVPPIIGQTQTVGQTQPGGATTSPVNQIKIIKTYQSDAAEAIKSQQQPSVAKIAIAQEERRREQGEEIGAAPKKRRGLLLMAIILIALGAAAIPTVQYLLNRKTIEVLVSTEKTIIPFDRQETLTLNNATRSDFISALDELQAKPPVTSVIKYVKILEKIQDVKDKTKTITKEITPDIFAVIIGPNMPSALARSFDSDYMYGTENSKPFILFKTSSYQQTFANMLRWETKMLSDLKPVLGLGTDVLSNPFTDKVVINKDIRTITASDGAIVFLYGFLDSQTLVITTNPQTFQEINSRYVAAHFVQ